MQVQCKYSVGTVQVQCRYSAGGITNSGNALTLTLTLTLTLALTRNVKCLNPNYRFNLLIKGRAITLRFNLFIKGRAITLRVCRPLGCLVRFLQLSVVIRYSGGLPFIDRDRDGARGRAWLYDTPVGSRLLIEIGMGLEVGRGYTVLQWVPVY